MDFLEFVIKLLKCYPRWVLVVAGLLLVAAVGLFVTYLPCALRTMKQVARIEFQSVPPFVDSEVLRYGSERYTVHFFSVRICNDSDKSINVRHLKLSDLEVLEGGSFRSWKNGESCVLDWDANKPKTIPGGDNVLAQFARVYPPDLQQLTDAGLWSGPYNIPQLRFISFFDQGRMTMKWPSKVPVGIHRFKITCFFDDAPPAEAKFELKCPPEKGRTTSESLVKKINIEMLKF